MKSLFEKVCADFETTLTEFDGEKDHVHLLVHYPPKVALSNWSTASKVFLAGCSKVLLEGRSLVTKLFSRLVRGRPNRHHQAIYSKSIYTQLRKKKGPYILHLK